MTGSRLSSRREVVGRRAPFSSSFPLPLGATGGARRTRRFRAFSQAGPAERVRRGVGSEISKLKQIYSRFLRYMFLSNGIPGSLLSVYRKSPALSHPVSSAPPRGVVSARQRGGFGAPAAGRPTAEPATSVKTGVARKWRRNRLKRLNQRREMVWSQKPRSHNIWYTAARLTVRSDRELRECQS